MARSSRLASPSGVYHVTSRGAGEMVIFEDDDDRREFLLLFEKAKQSCDAIVFAYCLMGNHVHIVLQIEHENLAVMMHELCWKYALYFNKRHGRVGHLFQERFYSIPIEKDSHLVATIRYVMRNPERAGICRASEYRWSSYREYCGEESLVDASFVLEQIGGSDNLDAFLEDGDGERPCCLGRKRRVSDEMAIEMIKRTFAIDSVSEITALDKMERDRCLLKMKKMGITIRQAARLTGIGKSAIERLYRYEMAG